MNNNDKELLKSKEKIHFSQKIEFKLFLMHLHLRQNFYSAYVVFIKRNKNSFSVNINSLCFCLWITFSPFKIVIWTIIKKKYSVKSISRGKYMHFKKQNLNYFQCVCVYVEALLCLRRSSVNGTRVLFCKYFLFLSFPLFINKNFLHGMFQSKLLKSYMNFIFNYSKKMTINFTLHHSVI